MPPFHPCAAPKKPILNRVKYLHFCPDFFGYVGKPFDEKAKVNFKIYDVKNSNTNNYTINILPDISKIKTIRQ